MVASWLRTLLLSSLVVLCGCGESSPPGSGAATGSGPAAAEGGSITGRVTGADDRPIAVAEDISINVYGVSEAGEKVSYAPAVKPDGTYRLKLVPGSYRIGRAVLKVKFGAEMFPFPLVPQGSQWNKDRDAKDGIQQDFVWNVTGKATEGAGDPNNHTHWYGMSIGMRFSIYRDDLKKPSQPPPAGTKLVFTLRPTSKCIDGRELQPITLERDFDPNRTTPNHDLNDLPPADWEISAVAQLPDGSTKTVLMQGTGDYPAFKPTIAAKLIIDGILGGMAKHLCAWVVE